MADVHATAAAPCSPATARYLRAPCSTAATQYLRAWVLDERSSKTYRDPHAPLEQPGALWTLGCRALEGLLLLHSSVGPAAQFRPQLWDNDGRHVQREARLEMSGLDERESVAYCGES